MSKTASGSLAHNLIAKLENAQSIINQSKLSIVNGRIKCETAILKWTEMIQNKDEQCLNDKLRQITRLKEKINFQIADYNLACTNDDKNNGRPNGRPNGHRHRYVNWSNMDQKVSHCLMNVNDLKLQSCTMFDQISVDWLELSLDLQNQVDQLKSDNEALRKQTHFIETSTKVQCNNKITKWQTMFENLQKQHKSMKQEFETLKQDYSLLHDKFTKTQNTLENKTKTLQLRQLIITYQPTANRTVYI